MFFEIQTVFQFVALLAGLAIFCAIAWRHFNWGLGLVLFLTPAYLFKINVGRLPLTVLEILILAIFCVWLVKKIRAKVLLSDLRNFNEDWNFWLPVLLVLVGTLVSVLFSLDIKISANIFKSWFLEPTVFGLIVFDSVKSKKQAINLCLALIASGVAVAAISLFYWLAGEITFDGRLKAFYQSPNQLAMFLSPCLILGVGLWCEAKKYWREFLSVGLLLIVASLYLAGSYSAWLAIFFGSLFFFLLRRWNQTEKKKLVLAGGVLAVVFLLMVLFQFQADNQKINNLLTSDRSSWQSRLMIWRAAGKILSDHWLFGIGPGLFQKYYLEYQKYFLPYLEWAVPQPHSIFLAFWLQAGLLGLAGFLWLVINFFKRFSDSGIIKLPLALALMAVMVYILIHGLLDTTYWKNDLSLVFWVVIFLGYKAARLRD